MKNYKITVSYDGTRYKGWQVLKSTDATIQGKLQMVLSALAGHPVEVIGSGRTDAGVHAIGQVANFHLDEHFSAEEIFEDLNRHLPEDIAVTKIKGSMNGFTADIRLWKRPTVTGYGQVRCRMYLNENFCISMDKRLMWIK